MEQLKIKQCIHTTIKSRFDTPTTKSHEISKVIFVKIKKIHSVKKAGAMKYLRLPDLTVVSLHLQLAWNQQVECEVVEVDVVGGSRGMRRRRHSLPPLPDR